jgi:hypothetical protein
MAKKTVKQSTKKEVEQPAETYTAQIKVFGKLYKATGNTVREALENLQPGGFPRGSSILIVSKGEVAKEKILNSIQTSRLFCKSKLMRELALKNISTLFAL